MKVMLVASFAVKVQGLIKRLLFRSLLQCKTLAMISLCMEGLSSKNLFHE